MSKKLVFAIAAAALLVVGSLAGTVLVSRAYAQTPTPEVEEVTATPAPAVRFGMRGNAFAGSTPDDAVLAEILGITEEEMLAARADAFEAAVADALEAGDITQAQADRIAAAGGMGWGLLVNLAGDDASIDFDAYLAEALGITVEALDAAKVEARDARIAAAVEAGELTQEQADLMQGGLALGQNSEFQEQIRAKIQETIQAQVEAGKLTQAQADAIIARIGEKAFGGMKQGAGMGNAPFGKPGMGGGMFGQGGMQGGNMPGGMFGQGGMQGGMPGRNSGGMFGQGTGGQGLYCTNPDCPYNPNN